MAAILSPEARIWRHVEPDTNGGCWLWTGSLSHRGYGVLKGDAGRPMKAHRFSWRAFRGAIPADAVVCHRCDTPACVNPDHLFLGDHAANMLDMRRKGRQSARVLDEEAVRHIRRREMTASGYAKLYGVSASAIRGAWTNRTWQHVHA